MKEIDKFEEIHDGNYVVITDISNGKKVHTLACSFVTEENFRLKVIENERARGSYYSINTLEEAEQLGAVPCRMCNPF